MKLIISCEVYKGYLEKLNLTENYQVRYLEIKQHNAPEKLRELLQAQIDDALEFEEVYLLYGICGNAIHNLINTSSKLIVLRVHDCFAALLGGNKKYFEVITKYPSYHWECSSNQGSEYLSQIKQEYLAQYDEETVNYLLDVYHQKSGQSIYVNFNSQEDINHLKQLDKSTLVIEGSLDLLVSFFNKNGDAALVLEKNEKITCIYDEVEIIRRG